MYLAQTAKIVIPAVFLGLLSGCGQWGQKAAPDYDRLTEEKPYAVQAATTREERERAQTGTIWDMFSSAGDPNVQVEVNKYIWQAALDVLDFLPIETVDPFTGVIVTGYGQPPGGGRAYRATIYVKDPALEARSLNLAMQTSGGGAVSRETVRAVEDAILTRARQLRVRDGRL